MRKGFTLIELMIVIAIIAIIAAIAIPNLLESRISSNEAAAATSLKSGVHPSQVGFQSGSYVDMNTNGIGDFATELSVMAGSSDATAGNALPDIALALLPQTWNSADDSGTTTAASACVTLNGYAFRTNASNEINFGAFGGPLDRANSIGRRCFAINAGGTVYSTAPATANAGRAESGGTASPFSDTQYTSFTSTWSTYRR